MWVFSETAHSSQTKLIELSLRLSERGIGISDLAIANNIGQYSVLNPWNAKKD